MIPLKASDIAGVLQAKLLGDDVEIHSVSTDSRQINAGDLFIALQDRILTAISLPLR